jgi:pyruvate/2-oxoacid:ferredoxin oxidoreductase beta subunit
MKPTLPLEELMSPGHLACQGCGAGIAMRVTLKALGRNSVFTFPACCWTVIDGPFPYSTLEVPLLHMAFEATAATASGIKAGMKMMGRDDVIVSGWAGDGGTFDIGIQALSGAAERNDDIFYFCYDNEAYMNTGIQRSGATPYGAWTTTTPVRHFKREPKKSIDDIVAAHRVPYQATASVAFVEDLFKKIVKAKRIRGFKFIHILAPCPPGWKSRPEDSVKLARLAVQTGVFPLYEVENGVYSQSIKSPNRKPVAEYLKLQGRFKHLTAEQVAEIQKMVDDRYAELEKRFQGN